MKVYYSLYDRILSPQALKEGFKKVKSAKGAPGIDGQSIKDFEDDLEINIMKLVNELREKRYRPLPVKRQEVPKPAGGVRILGIPAVRDRVVQQALLNTLQPIFDPQFHPSSYGYRPGRSCHQAIEKAALFAQRYDLRHVVDMDLSKCFDTLDHEIIMKQFRKRIADSSILNLIKLFLTSGTMTGEGWQATSLGSPQGGVISPLIANVYLDAFDQEMKKRGHRIVRYADDILIFCNSKSAAVNALKQATKLLERDLKLKVNESKTHIAESKEGIDFLGVTIYNRHIGIQEKKIKEFKNKVKKATRRNSPVNLDKVIKDVNPLIRGFSNYFRIANSRGDFRDLAGWIRRRLRAKQMCLWKKPKKLHRRLRQLGYNGNFKKIKMTSWRNASSPLAHYAMPNDFFEEMGLYNLESVECGLEILSNYG